MNTTLTPAQENLVQSKISTGRYRSMQEVIEIALLLFDEYEQAESEWSFSVRKKIQAAIDLSEQTLPIDGESFVEFLWTRRQESKTKSLATNPQSFFDVAQTLIGAGEGSGDISTNPDYMQGYGQ
jgi:antitoxin ParD1/3/4